jgi:hypothetical protein
MHVDYQTTLEYTRQGTPGYVMLMAGLVDTRSGDTSDDQTLVPTDALKFLFPGLTTSAFSDVLAALRDFIISYAYSQCGFLDGNTLSLDAVNRLRVLGVREEGLRQLRTLIVNAAAEARRSLSQTKHR